MSSILKQLTKGIWSQITTSDKNGEVLHLSGNSKVIYTEAPVIPVGHDLDTPVSRETVMREGFSYYAVAPADFVWALALTKDVKITVTPTGV